GPPPLRALPRRLPGHRAVARTRRVGPDRRAHDARPRHGPAPEPPPPLRRPRGPARARLRRDRRRRLPLEPDLRPRRHLGRRAGGAPRRGARAPPERRALGEPPNGDLRDPLAWLTGVAEQAFGWFVDRGMLPASRVDPAVFR